MKENIRILNLKNAAKTIISIVLMICLNIAREYKDFEHKKGCKNYDFYSGQEKKCIDASNPSTTATASTIQVKT